eukprot:gnl/Chilomastix_cuspidata/942.p1 GENE.gnl/Chilomastix_cuspidata/942~~gnl/Chilomastix_cuspidata/942.p1  ORF type:complete len:508 (-),score=232.58 gnl/Chilomastix_cuspidata/942:178-1701(-)
MSSSRPVPSAAVPEISYLSEDELRTIATYKYHGVDNSLLSKVLLNPFWEFLVNHVIPPWLAPNLITFFGFMALIIASMLTLAFSPNLATPDVPGWVWVAVALLDSLYQHLDGIDGKQARKTGTASSLGQIFDHGVDGLCIALHFMYAIALMEAGGTLIATLVLTVTPFVFSMYTLEEYITHVLRLEHFSGPVEGLFILQGLLVVCGIFGNGWLKREVFTLPFRLPFAIEPATVRADGSVAQVIGLRDVILALLLVAIVLFSIVSNYVSYKALCEREREEEELRMASKLAGDMSRMPQEDTEAVVEAARAGRRVPFPARVEEAIMALTMRKYHDIPISQRKPGIERFSAPEGIAPGPEGPLRTLLRLILTVYFPYVVVLVETFLLLAVEPRALELPIILVAQVLFGGLNMRVIVARVAGIRNLRRQLWPLYPHLPGEGHGIRVKNVFLVLPVIPILVGAVWPRSAVAARAFRVTSFFTVGSTVVYIVFSIREIARFLGIRVFHITPRE